VYAGVENGKPKYPDAAKGSSSWADMARPENKLPRSCAFALRLSRLRGDQNDLKHKCKGSN
jgi:hypothetical protein